MTSHSKVVTTEGGRKVLPARSSGHHLAGANTALRLGPRGLCPRGAAQLAGPYSGQANKKFDRVSPFVDPFYHFVDLFYHYHV